MDCRAERKKNQICSPATYANVFNALRALPPTVTQLVMLLGVPIAYPRMGLGETILESKFNPMSLLGKAGIMPGSVNKFNSCVHVSCARSLLTDHLARPNSSTT